MFLFQDLEQIHLEITNKCQASCPMCSRNFHGGLKNPNLTLAGWTLQKYKKIIDYEVLKQVKAIYFCGNYGDPLLNNDLLEMVDYSTRANPSLTIRIHTNGSLRSIKWWENLAKVLPKNHLLIFAIDGLEDTHHTYRIGTDYNKILDNAKAFIAKGGRAEWAFIRFKHNEHQVQEARQIAENMGFERFTMKDSSRWLGKPSFEVLDKKGETDYFLEPSQYSDIQIIDNEVIKNYKEIVRDSEIFCHALKQKEVYIDTFGHLWPCCWLGQIPYQPADKLEIMHEVRKDIKDQYYKLLDSLGGYDAIDAEKSSVKSIINSPNYQTVWDKYWKGNDKLITCAGTCGKSKVNFSKPNDQFVNKENLNL